MSRNLTHYEKTERLVTHHEGRVVTSIQRVFFNDNCYIIVQTM